MERNISVGIYVVAFIIAAVLFSIGVYVGTIIDNTAISVISQDVSSLSQRLMTLQLLSLMDENSSAFCPAYKSEFVSIESEREKLGYELTFLEDKKGLSDPETKKKYFLLEAQSYLLAKKLNENCNDNSIIMLYFYSNKDCTDCKQQGAANLAARDAAVSHGKTVRIYSYDGELGSPIVDALKAQYSISRYPSVVINGKLYSGPMGEPALVEAMKNAD